MAALDNVPGLAGYLAGQQQSQQSQLGNLQQAQMLMGLQGAIQQQQQQQAQRQAIAGLGPNPSVDQLGAVVARTDPSKAYDIMARAEDKKAALRQSAAIAQSRLDQQRQNAEMIHEFRMGQLNSAADRQAESERHNKAMEQLNAQNAQLNQQMKMMGLDLKKTLAEAAANKPMTESQGKAALYGTRAAQSDKVLKALEDKISLPGLAAGQATGMLGNYMMSSEQQRVDQAQRDFVNAVLRQESGAVISDAEFANAKRQYFPVAGDNKAAIDQKRANRQLAIQGFMRMSGPRGESDIKAIIDNPLLPGVNPNPVTPQANTVTPAQFREGQTATGPNGQKIIFQGGKWQPIQ